MANRKRKDDECFQCYRRHLKEEEKATKAKLRFRQIWTSVILVPDAKKKDLLPILRPLIQMKVRGAFNRYKGHSMPNSLYEKHRRERVLDKLRKRGMLPDAT